MSGWLPRSRRSSTAHTSAAYRCSSTLPSLRLTDPCRRRRTSSPSAATRCTRPFGAGALIGPRTAFLDGDPFLVGGGAVDLVDLDETVWNLPPDREEAGSPNLIGAVALHAAIEALENIGWEAIAAHDAALARQLRSGLAAIPGVRLLGPALDVDTLPIATFLVEGVPHALLAARLSAEFAIGVRHGCFCAHPYLVRLLGLSGEDLEQFRAAARHHDRRSLPGAVRASCGISTSAADIERFLDRGGDRRRHAAARDLRRRPADRRLLAGGPCYAPTPGWGRPPAARRVSDRAVRLSAAHPAR